MSRVIECPVCRRIVAVRSDASSCGASKCRMSVYRARKKGMKIEPKEVATVMTENRPYVLRAFYDWLVDNKLTPTLVADTTVQGVQVPQQYTEDGYIVLDISGVAVGNLKISNECVDFSARFGGVPYDVSLPIDSIEAIYAKENGAGTVFGLEEPMFEGEEEECADRPTDSAPSRHCH